MTRNELIAHPIRIRIFGALTGQSRTTAEIAQMFGDIPPATLYRQIAILIEAGLINVTGHEIHRGRSTRILALPKGGGYLDRSQIDMSSIPENTNYVNTFFAGQMAVYADAVNDEVNVPGDWKLNGYVGYFTAKEEREFLHKLNALVEEACNKPKSSDRKLRSISIGSLPHRNLTEEKSQ